MKIKGYKLLIMAVILGIISAGTIKTSSVLAHPKEFETNMDDFPMGACGSSETGAEYRRQAYNMGPVGGLLEEKPYFCQDEKGKIYLDKEGISYFEKMMLYDQKHALKQVFLGIDQPFLKGPGVDERRKQWNMVTESGKSTSITGRWCYNNPDYRKVCREILLLRASHTKDAKAHLEINGKKVAGILNEANWSQAYNKEWVCYCPYCRQAWTKWIGKKYGTVDKLNRDWQSNYNTFEEIDLPHFKAKGDNNWPALFHIDDKKEIFKSVNQAHWMCWLLFRRDSLYGFMEEMIQTLKSADPDVIGTTHGYYSWLAFRNRLGSAASSCVNRHLDFGMVDAANAIFFGGKHLPPELLMYDTMLDQTHSAVGNKPAWAIIQADHLQWLTAPGYPTGEDIERMEIMAALYGMVFQIEGWYDTPDSILKQSGGSLGLHDGIYNTKEQRINLARFIPVKRAYRVLQDFGRYLASSDFEHEQVAILWAWEEHFQGIMAVPIQMLVREMGYHCNFIEQEDLDPDKFDYKALIISSQPRLSEKSVENIKKLAEKGVSILVDAASAHQDWCGREQNKNLLSELTKADFGDKKSRPSLVVKKNYWPFTMLKQNEEQVLWAGLTRCVKSPMKYKVTWRSKEEINNPKYRNDLNTFEVDGPQGISDGFYRQLQPLKGSMVMCTYNDGTPAAVIYNGDKYKAMTVGFNLGWEYWQGIDSYIFPVWSWACGYFGIPYDTCHVGPRCRDYRDEIRLDFFRRFMQGFLDWAGVKKTVKIEGLKAGEYLSFRNIKTPTWQFVSVVDLLDVDYSEDHLVTISIKEMPKADYAIMDQSLKEVPFEWESDLIKIKTTVPKAGYRILMIASRPERDDFLDYVRHRIKPGKDAVKDFLTGKNICIVAGEKCAPDVRKLATDMLKNIRNGKLVSDTEIKEKELAEQDLILLGNPDENAFSALLRDRGFTTIGPYYPGETYGVIELNEGVFDKAHKVLLVAGSSAEGTANVAKRALALATENASRH